MRYCDNGTDDRISKCDLEGATYGLLFNKHVYGIQSISYQIIVALALPLIFIPNNGGLNLYNKYARGNGGSCKK